MKQVRNKIIEETKNLNPYNDELWKIFIAEMKIYTSPEMIHLNPIGFAIIGKTLDDLSRTIIR